VGKTSFTTLAPLQKILPTPMASEKIFQGVRKPIPGPIVSGVLVETCTACLYSNQNTDLL